MNAETDEAGKGVKSDEDVQVRDRRQERGSLEGDIWVEAAVK